MTISEMILAFGLVTVLVIIGVMFFWDRSEIVQNRMEADYAMLVAMRYAREHSCDDISSSSTTDVTIAGMHADSAYLFRDATEWTVDFYPQDQTPQTVVVTRTVNGDEIYRKQHSLREHRERVPSIDFFDIHADRTVLGGVGCLNAIGDDGVP